MTSSVLNATPLPYCKGCGHALVAKSAARALETCGLAPLDVVSVSDIGCHGIIDRCLDCHTVHGLHGRSPALAAGLAAGLPADGSKKVVVFIGDGGATIGLQHILEAARLNLPMTVLVHNNFLYGMTGGQTSGLTPGGFRTTTSAEGNPYGPYDLCALVVAAGASHVARVIAAADMDAGLVEAFRSPGFSLVEILELCPSYGVSRNPGRKLAELAEEAGRPVGVWRRPPRPGLPPQAPKTGDLIAGLETVAPEFPAVLRERMGIVLSGSAGEGVQTASSILARAAMLSGCHVTQKGSYPVTVGVGFSAAELVVSPRPIRFHGIGQPDAVVVTSADGLHHEAETVQGMTSGLVLVDESLPVPATGARVLRGDFRGIGARNASVFALFVLARETGLVAVDALFRAAGEGKLGGKLPLDAIRERLGAMPPAPGRA